MLTLAILMKPLFRKSMHDPVIWIDGDAQGTRLRAGWAFAIDLVILVGLVLFVQLWTIWDINGLPLALWRERDAL